MPYTSHGHWYGPGEPTEPGPRLVARCGGPGLCSVCAKEAVALPRVERDEDGHPVWIHYCTALDPETVRATLPLGEKGWNWTADGGLEPSIHCMACGVHGFWAGGDIPAWRSC